MVNYNTIEVTDTWDYEGFGLERNGSIEEDQE
jgi:hypothetical protein